MKLKTCSYRSLVRAGGIYDIAIMLPFAIPGAVSWTMAQLQTLHDALYLSGDFPSFAPFHLFFINLMACITIVWSVLRVHTPAPVYGLYDSAARLLIVALMGGYMLHYNVSGVLWLFVLSELTWAALQINGYFFKYKNDPALTGGVASNG